MIVWRVSPICYIFCTTAFEGALRFWPLSPLPSFVYLQAMRVDGHASPAPSPAPLRRSDSPTENDDCNTLVLTSDEAVFLQASWNRCQRTEPMLSLNARGCAVHCRAMETTDVGAELVIRLLNDKRSLFKSLLESHTGHIDIERFTVEIVNRDLKRAKEVGQGVVRFFTKVKHISLYAIVYVSKLGRQG